LFVSPHEDFSRLAAFYLSSSEVGILLQYAVVTSFSESCTYTVELASNLKPGDFILVNSKTSLLLSVFFFPHSRELFEGEREESTVVWFYGLDYTDT